MEFVIKKFAEMRARYPSSPGWRQECHGLNPAQPKVNMRPDLKNKLKAKKTEGMSEVVEHLPSKCEALSSIPSAEKKTLLSEISRPRWFYLRFLPTSS
jgi:hypothetical protein